MRISATLCATALFTLSSAAGFSPPAFAQGINNTGYDVDPAGFVHVGDVVKISFSSPGCTFTLTTSSGDKRTGFDAGQGLIMTVPPSATAQSGSVTLGIQTDGCYGGALPPYQITVLPKPVITSVNLASATTAPRPGQNLVVSIDGFLAPGLANDPDCEYQVQLTRTDGGGAYAKTTTLTSFGNHIVGMPPAGTYSVSVTPAPAVGLTPSCTGSASMSLTVAAPGRVPPSLGKTPM